jgi:hypothetical protein
LDDPPVVASLWLETLDDFPLAGTLAAQQRRRVTNGLAWSARTSIHFQHGNDGRGAAVTRASNPHRGAMREQPVVEDVVTHGSQGAASLARAQR